jgi:hypothetical protein
MDSDLGRSAGTNVKGSDGGQDETDIAEGGQDESFLTSFTLRDYAQEKPWSADEEKYRGGTWVAKAIVVTFAASVVLWFALIFTLVISGRTAEEVAKFATILGALLKDYSAFAGVFSPLLAFVLGYYFGEKKG